MKKIIKIDASLLSNSSCLLKMWLTTFKGFRKEAPSANIEQGSAIHKFIESYRLNKNLPEEKREEHATVEAIKYFSNVPKTYNNKNKYINEGTVLLGCKAFLKALKTYEPLSKFVILEDPETRIPLVEEKFAIPYYEDDEILILLCGTIDSIGYMEQTPELLIIDDIKSSAKSKLAIETELRSYELSLQLMIYRIAVEWLAKNKPDSVYARAGKIGCRITGIFIPATLEVEVKCSNVYYYDDKNIEQVKELIKKKVLELIPYLKGGGSFPLKEGILTGECKSYGACQFAPVCKFGNEEDMQDILNAHYKVVEYDPLTFR